MRILIQNKQFIFTFAIALFIFLNTSIGLCQITAPDDYLGYKPGADFHLATYEQLTEYFQIISNQSDRMKLFDMGPTTEGRRMLYAVISSKENIAELEKYQEITRRLSLADNLSDEEAKKLADQGKVVVWIESGLHSSEISPSMHQFQLVYDLVTDSDQKTRFIRDNVILLLVLGNPDGMTTVANWYMKNVGTKYEMSSLPELYHKYAGHDNNRDSFMANLVEIQNMNRVVGQEWFPELIYVQHETAPFPARIWIPPNPEPVNPNVHPLITRWKNLIGSAMGHAFDGEDKPGAISRTAFDLWYPGYTDGPSVEGHNIPSVLTETANYGYATPHFYKLSDFPAAYQDLTAGTFYPSPWEGGWWRFQDAVDYNLTGSKSVLDVAAKYRQEFLYYKYKMAKDVIERFKNESPYGWIIDAEQPDQSTTAMMINRMIGYGVEVYKAEDPFLYEGISYSRGSYIIPTSQPFGLYVKNILERQQYPDMRKYKYLWQGVSGSIGLDGAPLSPYDGVGWTLPLQLGVEAQQINTPLDINQRLISEASSMEGNVTGDGAYYVFTHSDNNSFLAVNLIMESDGQVGTALDDFTLRGTNYPKGTFVVEAGTTSRTRLIKIASQTHIQMVGGTVSIKQKHLSRPKIALYKSWSANMDAGWISYLFDKYGFDYHLLTDVEVRAGGLLDRFDVIVLPDQGASSIINGRKKGTMPLEYVGGMSMLGVENLLTFVETGGTLICNKSSAELAIKQFDLPVKNLLEGVDSGSFNCPGSIVKMSYDTDNPIAYGMKEEGIAFLSRGMVFESAPIGKGTDELKPKVVAKYPDEPLLLSGWILGEDVIRGQASILDVPLGKGRVVLFGFNIVNRAQAYSTIKLLFNAILLPSNEKSFE